MIFPFWKKKIIFATGLQAWNEPGLGIEFLVVFFLWSPSTLPESITPMLIKIWNHQRNLYFVRLYIIEFREADLFICVLFIFNHWEGWNQSIYIERLWAHLVGGFIFFNVHPDPWGDDSHFDLSTFFKFWFNHHQTFQLGGKDVSFSFSFHW